MKTKPKLTSMGKAAFTLIELLVVIAIIAILAALLVAGPGQVQAGGVARQLPEQLQATHGGGRYVRRRQHGLSAAQHPG
jgi:prepilin-type N-terminal cleavage/methylation domain-containing protein